MCCTPITAIHLLPMNFQEIDVARQVAVLTSFSDKRGKKRLNATVARLIHQNNNNNKQDHHHQYHHLSSQQQQQQPPLSTNTSTSTSTSAANTTSSISPIMNATVPNVATTYNTSLSSACLKTAMAVVATTTAAATTTSSSTAENEVTDLRTGRWTPEETVFCDELIKLFEQGKLPISEGIKLNDFLASMLKSKQARLTKKMKNAKLATRQYKLTTGYIPSPDVARAFSVLEADFFTSIKCPMERSEIRFHMQKEWRDMFSSHCIAMGQILDANAWLTSVEELDQRTTLQKDAARMVRRKVMLGQALTLDSSNNLSRGVHINTASKTVQLGMMRTNGSSNNTNHPATTVPTSITTSPPNPNLHCNGATYDGQEIAQRAETLQHSDLLLDMARIDRNPLMQYASPFIEKVMKVVDRLALPFEHVDTWVPSFVDNDGETPQQNCRLCFAGCGTAQSKMTSQGPVPLTTDEQFDLRSFGEYSEKFSFDIGCGLPGRVYNSGVASWEQGIRNAPLQQFERIGGTR
jgi:hypothetical protein